MVSFFYFIFCLFYFLIFVLFFSFYYFVRFVFVFLLFSSCFHFVHFHELIFLVFFSLLSFPFDIRMRSSSLLDKTMEKIHIFRLCHMKGHETSITFHQKTWHQACLIFMLSALKKATAKNYFLHYDI